MLKITETNRQNWVNSSNIFIYDDDIWVLILKLKKLFQERKAKN